MDLTETNYPDTLDLAEGSSAPTKREVKGARRVRNACLQCRERKIRCSRTYPCKGCVSRGDGEACDWQGGFPSGDIPIQQQRAAQQRQEFDDLHRRIFETKSVMSRLLRQDPTSKAHLDEWTQLHPELDDICHDVPYPDLFSSAQHNSTYSTGHDIPDWALSSLYPPDSAASFESCTSSATESSTFHSLANGCSSSHSSPPTAGSFLIQPDLASPIPFLKPCNTSGYKSWKNLREASGLPVYTNETPDPVLLQQQNQHASVTQAYVPHPSQFISFPDQFYPTPFLNQQNLQTTAAPIAVTDPLWLGGVHQSTGQHLYPTSSNPHNYNDSRMPSQGFEPSPYCFQAHIDRNIYGGHIVPRTLPRITPEMAIPKSHRNSSTPGSVTWMADNQPAGPQPIGMGIDINMLTFDPSYGRIANWSVERSRLVQYQR